MNKDGAVNFVLHKIKARNHPSEIADALARMGYGHEDLSQIFIEVGKVTDSLHQELIESNDFLPPLNQKHAQYFKQGNLEIFKATIVELSKPRVAKFESYLLFPYPADAPFNLNPMKSGNRMTRHSFVFRLMYSCSMAVLGVILGYVLIRFFEPSNVVDEQVRLAYWKGRLFSPGAITLMALISIFALYVLQLFAHRLKNAGMSSYLSLLLLTPLLINFVSMTGIERTLMIFMSCIPAVSVFIIAVLTPPEHNRI